MLLKAWAHVTAHPLKTKFTVLPIKTHIKYSLEPEGLDTHELYPNGISTSLPFDVQFELVRSIRGMENAHILRPDCTIEYDYFNPQALKFIETKAINNLAFAGQSMVRQVMKRWVITGFAGI